jgi:hypothetical protein
MLKIQPVSMLSCTYYAERRIAPVATVESFRSIFRGKYLRVTPRGPQQIGLHVVRGAWNAVLQQVLLDSFQTQHPDSAGRSSSMS